MASVSSASSANQYGFQQLSLQQARRSADRAEQVARSLKAEANDAQRVADQANQNARTLASQSNRAQVEAGQARLGVAALTSQQSVIKLTNTIGEASIKQQFSIMTSQGDTPKPLTAAPSPVVNSQGQVTGKIVNATA